MPETKVLAIGLDLPVPLKKVLENQGLLLTQSNSREEANSLLQSGNYDLCLIGKAISGESKESLIALLRQNLHSGMPVIAMTRDSGPSEILGNLTHIDGLEMQLPNLRQLLAQITQPASF